MVLKMLAGLLGGIGLFLLGMRLMTEGLKFAAGRTLHHIIAHSTSTRLRGILSGALITSLVQSSGAVTVATIGFVNAGMMHLSQAISLVYGSNIGTTMTGWLVALVGFEINVKALALPAIGLGMLIRLVAGSSRRGALGEALAGFGLFFLGIHELNAAFAGLGANVQLTALAGRGLASALLFVGIGFLLTFLMQSSSAAMAIALTAASGGFIPLESAAALVIGANVGTTSTAALAVLGATANAKRVAAAHVVFNLVTGLVALLMLPLLLHELVFIRQRLGLGTKVTVLLASFHTVFNLLGVLLFFPFTGRLVVVLKRFFRSTEGDEARPRFLDRTVLGTPSFAMQALAKELARLGAIALRMGKGALSSEGSPSPSLLRDKAILDKLVDAAGDFSNQLQRSHLPPELDDMLPMALRVSGYYTILAELALEVAHSRDGLLLPSSAEDLAPLLAHYQSSAVKFLDRTEKGAGLYEIETGSQELARLKEEYRALKARLLRSGTQGKLSPRQMVGQLELIRSIMHMAEQAEKGARYLTLLQNVPQLPRTEEGADRNRPGATRAVAPKKEPVD